MKQFIYLDTDVVNSIIAQKEKGLVISKKEENGSEYDNQKRNNISSHTEVGGKASFLHLFDANINQELNAELEKHEGLTRIEKELIEKSYHDAAYDRAYQYIIEELGGKIDDECNYYGSYIKLTRSFDVVDLNYLEGLFSENSLINYLRAKRRC